MRIHLSLLLAASFLFGNETEEEALFLRRIADFWEEKEVQMAKGQMEEFIARFPESSYCDPLLAALGDLAMREKNYEKALQFYSQIKGEELQNRIAISRLQCLYEMQWYATLAQECETLLDKKGANSQVSYFLAIALYHQCLNGSKDSENLIQLANRAKPHFEMLLNSEYQEELAQGYAHLCTLLKEYPKASEMYLCLAQKEPEREEEMLFQAALVQSQYDRELAVKTFEKIVQIGGKKGKEATYNRMVLLFDLGRYSELANSHLIGEIPADRKAIVHLFQGKSLAQLKKYQPAIEEFKAYLTNSDLEHQHAAIANLLDAATQIEDLASLDYAIEKLLSLNPKDPQLPKAYLCKAQLLAKSGKTDAAKALFEELIEKFPTFPEKALALCELTHLHFKAKDWNSCEKQARLFLSQFPNHELGLTAWRYAISSTVEMAKTDPSLKESLLADLEEILKFPIDESEQAQWKLFLAKTHLDLGQYDQAFEYLQHLQTPNGHLLLAFCYRDGYADLPRFCEFAELALSEGADWAFPDEIHTSLFNAYLEQNDLEKAADHLFLAFEANGKIQKENLLWLADYYLSQKTDHSFFFAQRAARILESFEDPIAHIKLAKAYSILGRTDEQIALLEKTPSLSLEEELLLAEGYAKKAIIEKAIALFDHIVEARGVTRDPTSASARLQSARLKLQTGHADLTKIATELKNLVIQKTFSGEPTYLEAALDYVDLQAQGDRHKKMALLQKTKKDFESQEDLLSKDYHAARCQSPEKNHLYQGYMELIDAQIWQLQAEINPESNHELKTQSKSALLKIIHEQTASALLQRATMLLTSFDEPKSKT